jgi:hypothetical protein
MILRNVPQGEFEGEESARLRRTVQTGMSTAVRAEFLPDASAVIS